MTLQELARSLGGEVRGNQFWLPVLATAQKIGRSRLSRPTRRMASSFTPTQATIRSNARTMSASECGLAPFKARGKRRGPRRPR